MPSLQAPGAASEGLPQIGLQFQQGPPSTFPDWDLAGVHGPTCSAPHCRSTYNRGEGGIQLPLKLEIQSSCGISLP